MYIKDYHKDLFITYIRNSGYSPISIRNIISDVKSIFVWLHANEFDCHPNSLPSRYEQYLILSKTNIHTTRRKVSTAQKLTSWLAQTYPDLDNSNDSHLQSNHVVSTGWSRPNQSITASLQSPITSIFVVSTLIISFLLVMYLGYLFTRSENHLQSSSPNQVLNYNYVIQTEHIIGGTLKALHRDNLEFMFIFYSSNDNDTVIGQSLCPAELPLEADGKTTLVFQFGPKCNPFPTAIYEIYSKNMPFWYDVYLGEQKINAMRVEIASNAPLFADSHHQNNTNTANDLVVTPTQLLPESDNISGVLGLETSLFPNTYIRSIPLSILNTFEEYSDGEVVALYENQLVRALLSAQVLGIKEADRIIQEGVVYVQAVQNDVQIIQTGDVLATSTTPGKVKRVDSMYDTVVGMALESQSNNSPYIKAYINIR